MSDIPRNDADLAAKADDPVLWLGTVAPSGRPTIRPVWFVHVDDTLVVFTAADAAKVRHVRAHPDVVVTFHSDPEAAHVLVVSGRAEVTDGPPPSTVPEYLAKYEPAYPAVGYDRESFDAGYGTRITITPTRSWGW